MLSPSVSDSLTNIVLQHPLLGRILNGVEIREWAGETLRWKLKNQRDLVLEVPIGTNDSKDDHLIEAVKELDRFLSNQNQQASPVNYPNNKLAHFLPQWNTLTPCQQYIVIQDFKRITSPADSFLDSQEEELHKIGFSRAQIEATTTPLPWQTLLKRFVQTQLGNIVRHSNHRVSQRYGTVPGIRRMRERKLGLAIDTSGSIPLELLDIFYKEVRKIHQYQGFLPVVEFDHRIQRSYNYQPGRTSEPKGGGGTLFDPPLQWAKQQKLQALIIFTDGQAAPPTVPFGKEILWVVYGEPPVWMSECLVINF